MSDERYCATCGDAVQYLSSNDRCDACEASPPTPSVSGLHRFTILGDYTCDRCSSEILDGEYAGRVEQGLHRLPLAAGTLLCSQCADRLEEKYR